MSINTFQITRHGRLTLLIWFLHVLPSSHTHLDIEAHVFVSLVMCGIQFRDELATLHTRVLSKRTWQHLKGFGKFLNSVLLQTRAGLWHKNKVMSLSFVTKCSNQKIRNEWAVNATYLSVGSKLLGQFDLCGTCSRYQPLVLGNQHVQHSKQCYLR